MRLKGLIVATALVASVPAHAEWKEYTFVDLGIRKDFPDAPKTSKGEYKTGLLGTLPSTVLTASEPGSDYTLTVVDLPKDRWDDSASIMSECNYNAMLAGKKVVADMSAEFGLGKASVYGRWASVTQPDDTRKLTACYSIKGKLYIVESHILKSNPDFPNSPDAFRFVQGLDFNTDPNRDAPRPPRPAGAPGGAPAGN